MLRRSHYPCFRCPQLSSVVPPVVPSLAQIPGPPNDVDEHDSCCLDKVILEGAASIHSAGRLMHELCYPDTSVLNCESLRHLY